MYVVLLGFKADGWGGENKYNTIKVCRQKIYSLLEWEKTMQVAAYVEIVHRSVQLNPPIKDVKFLQ